MCRIKDTLRRMIGTHMSWQSTGELVGDVNRVARGWMNYFSYGTLWKTYTKLERFLQRRLRGWPTSIGLDRAVDIPQVSFTRPWAS